MAGHTHEKIHMEGIYARRYIHTDGHTHDGIYSRWDIHMNGTYTRREIYTDRHTPKVVSDTGGEVSRFLYLELTGGVLL